MLGVFFSLFPLIGWGVGDYAASKLSRKLDSYTISLFFSLTGFVFSTPIALLFGAPVFYAYSIINFTIASLFINAGFLMLVRGFKYGPAGIVAPIANAYAIITTATAIVFLNENIELITLLGISVVVAGIAVVSYSKPKPGEFKDMKKTLQSAIISLLMFGTGFYFFDKASVQDWNQNHILFEIVTVIVSGLIWVYFQKKNKLKQLKAATKIPLLYIGGFAGSAGLMGMFAALKITGSIAVPAAIGAAAPLMTAFLAYKFDKEHLTLLQRFATVIIVAGIIILSI